VHPFGGIRHCLPLAPGLFLLAACGLDELGRKSRVSAALLAAALVACAASGIHDVRDWYYEDVPGVLEEARASATQGDVLFVDAWSRPAFLHYAKELAWPGPVALGESQEPMESLARELEVSAGKGSRVWVLYARQRELAVLGALGLLGDRFAPSATVERRHGVIYVRATMLSKR
jgi:hypothetical protein